MPKKIKIDTKQVLASLFKKQFETLPIEIKALPQSGSERRYYYMTDGSNIVLGVHNADRNENQTFFYFTELFNKHKIAVPKIIGHGDNKGHYLISYIPGKTLMEIIKEEGHTDRVKSLFQKCISNLLKIQWELREEVDYDMCYGAKEFDKDQILSDLMYFKYYFLDIQSINYDRISLFTELQEWSKELASMMPKSFMYRDFQSRNIIVDENDDLTFIDYQGGMQGLPQYDLASLLWQAKAELPLRWKNELFNYYFEELVKMDQLVHINEMEFKKGYFDTILLRMLQTLGAYGYRGLIQKKRHFIESIPVALNQLRQFLDDNPGSPAKQELRSVLEQITKQDILDKYRTTDTKSLTNNDVLHIHIYSFSYKKGIPNDEYGNGGGFIFDCRGILNPGRIEGFENLTGKDKRVIDYLENDTLMPQFINNVMSVLSINIDNYLERGFENLFIGFGCTGGQHRSVYAAEKVASIILNKYRLKHIEVIHLEQDNHQIDRLKK